MLEIGTKAPNFTLMDKDGKLDQRGTEMNYLPNLWDKETTL